MPQPIFEDETKQYNLSHVFGQSLLRLGLLPTRLKSRRKKGGCIPPLDIFVVGFTAFYPSYRAKGFNEILSSIDFALSNAKSISTEPFSIPVNMVCIFSVVTLLSIFNNTA